MNRNFRLRPEVAALIRQLPGHSRDFDPILPEWVTSTSQGPVVPDAPVEPVFSAADLAQIQGNIVPGFNKPFQHFLFLEVVDTDGARYFLRGLTPELTPMSETLLFARAYRDRRNRGGRRDVGLEATWVNVAFSSQGLSKLMDPGEVAELKEQSFHQGLAARSTYLGDPSDPNHAGHATNWRVGGPDTSADILLTVASDSEESLARWLSALRPRLSASRLRVVFEQAAAALPGDHRGHEHFGFRDGISQPAMRGRASSAPTDFIVPRYLSPEGEGLERAKMFAKPGQPLIWPGQFLLGLQRQDPNDVLASVPPRPRVPAWARLGSFLVCRRLLQNVPSFWSFVEQAAAEVGLDPVQLASTLVGRWPSGAPLLRSPGGDDPRLGADDLANNHFFYQATSRPSQLASIAGYAGDDFPQAEQDVLGSVCPHFAHIRKMNPRDSGTDMGPYQDSLIRLILRRGITFGRSLLGVANPSQELLDEERGLMFVCYAASIEEQFEFLQRRWANNPLMPTPQGVDLLMGQSDRAGNRTREAQLPTSLGGVTLRAEQDFVVPTGGGYFFAPPIGTVLGLGIPDLWKRRRPPVFDFRDIARFVRPEVDPPPPPFNPLIDLRQLRVKTFLSAISGRVFLVSAVSRSARLTKVARTPSLSSFRSRLRSLP